jgi:hypothetical protein
VKRGQGRTIQAVVDALARHGAEIEPGAISRASSIFVTHSHPNMMAAM